MDVYHTLAEHTVSVFGMQAVLPDMLSREPLEKLYELLITEQEAEKLLSLDDQDITVTQFVRQTGLNRNEGEQYLEKMSHVGVVFARKAGECWKYHLAAPLPELVDSVGAGELTPALAEQINIILERLQSRKIIPIQKEIQTKIYQIPYEEVLEYIEQTDRYSVSDCICRKFNQIRGQGCSHPIADMCIQTGSNADFFVKTGRARPVVKEEVLDVLKRAKDAGLSHEIYLTDKNPQDMYICNCCLCGCVTMDMTDRVRHVLKNETELAVVMDGDPCGTCRQCIENCPVQALFWNETDGSIVRQVSACIQCGLCEILCPAGHMKT